MRLQTREERWSQGPFKFNDGLHEHILVCPQMAASELIQASNLVEVTASRRNELTTAVEMSMGNNTHTLICNSSDYNRGKKKSERLDLLFFFPPLILKIFLVIMVLTCQAVKAAMSVWELNYFLQFWCYLYLLPRCSSLQRWPTSLQGIKIADLIIPPPIWCSAPGLQCD